MHFAHCTLHIESGWKGWLNAGSGFGFYINICDSFWEMTENEEKPRTKLNVILLLFFIHLKSLLFVSFSKRERKWFSLVLSGPNCCEISILSSC